MEGLIWVLLLGCSPHLVVSLTEKGCCSRLKPDERGRVRIHLRDVGLSGELVVAILEMFNAQPDLDHCRIGSERRKEKKSGQQTQQNRKHGTHRVGEEAMV